MKNMGYVQLAIAIVGEVIGTSFLKASQSFSKPLPALLAVGAYVVCFYCFSLSMKSLNLGVAYATWGGVGITLTTALSALLWHESVSLPEILGIVMIIAGVVLCNLFAKA